MPPNRWRADAGVAASPAPCERQADRHGMVDHRDPDAHLDGKSAARKKMLARDKTPGFWRTNHAASGLKRVASSR